MASQLPFEDNPVEILGIISFRRTFRSSPAASLFHNRAKIMIQTNLANAKVRKPPVARAEQRVMMKTSIES
jgi:hypothetical protein